MIYLDNCATTMIRKEVLEVIYNSYTEDFGNPSSLHRVGLNSEKKIDDSRELIAKYLRVRPREIFFTSGGTESNNMAISGSVEKMKRRGNHIITTKIEHPSVINYMKKLEKDGFEVSYLDVDQDGLISLEDFENKITEETILVSIIHVNNEIGSIQNIKKISEIMTRIKSKAMLHLDGVQSFGKINFNLKELKVDTYSFSSHKVHGPKGIGGIYIRENSNIPPYIYGGNQESGLRSGTENVQGIVGFGKAVELILRDQKSEIEKVEEIKKYTMFKVKEEIDDVKFNSGLDDRYSPYILNLSVRNTRGEVLLHYLEDKEIYVSTSSACSSTGTAKSHVLEAIGLDTNEIEGTLRICFSYETDFEDIDYMVKVLKESVEKVREIMMRWNNWKE